MNPNEVVEKLGEMGVKISRKTLYNWEQWGLIPQAIFRNSRATDYPQDTPFEAFASWFLMNKEWRLSPEHVSKVRMIALQDKLPPFTGNNSIGNLELNFQAVRWKITKLFAENGFMEDAQHVYFNDPPDNEDVSKALACNGSFREYCKLENDLEYVPDLRQRIFDGGDAKQCLNYNYCLELTKDIKAAGYLTYVQHAWLLTIKVKDSETGKWLTYLTEKF